MNEKYLPIKIFEKRKDYDDRSTEGGGDSHESSWVLHGEELKCIFFKRSEIIQCRCSSGKYHADLSRSEELIDNVREAVENNPEIKIWNLSLGTTMESELDEFSEFGMALDNIQDENNVLIIKSAGNCTNFAKGLPKSRISKTADSARSLVVGSIAETQEEKDYAEPNMPSPFTRVGPGPASIVKPDLVYYGG